LKLLDLATAQQTCDIWHSGAGIICTISHDHLKSLSLLGKLAAQQIESRQLIELDTVKAY